MLSKTVDWEEEFTLKCSMSPSSKGKPYEDKMIYFQVLEEDAPGKKGKPLGKVSDDVDGTNSCRRI